MQRDTTLARCRGGRRRNSPGVWSLRGEGAPRSSARLGHPHTGRLPHQLAATKGGQSVLHIVGTCRLLRKLPLAHRFRAAGPGRQTGCRRDIAQLLRLLCDARQSQWHHAPPSPARCQTPLPAVSPLVMPLALPRCLGACGLTPCSLWSDDAPAAAPARSGDPVSLAAFGQHQALSYPACLPKPCLLRCSSMALRDLRSARMSTVPQRQRRERSAPVVSGRSWLPL